MNNQITPNPSVPSQVVAEVKFPKFINNLGIIPTSYKDSMSYYECLAWLCKFLEEQVIPTVNENGEAVEELQALYIELNSYVTNYFENLDVQEEINNKLDEMVESGYFENILENYLHITRVYDTTSEMILDYSNLVNGQKVKTLGYYSINDGGQGYFYITNTENSSKFQIELANDLYAELVVNDNYYNVLQCGAKRNDSTDTSPLVEKLLSINGNTGGTIYFPKGTYKFYTSIVTDNSSAFIIGENKQNTILNYISDDYLFKLGNTKNVSEFKIQELMINSATGGGIWLYRYRIFTSKIYQVTFDCKKESILFESDGAYNEFERLSFRRTYEPSTFIKIDGKVNIRPNYLYFNNCYFEGNNSDDVTALKLGSCLYLYFNECDFCNFQGTAIKFIEPFIAGGHSQNIFFKNTTLFANAKHIEIENNVAFLGTINFENCNITKPNNQTVNTSVLISNPTTNQLEYFYFTNCYIDVTSLNDTSKSMYINNCYITTNVTNCELINRYCNVPIVCRITVPVNNNEAQDISFSLNRQVRKTIPTYLQAIVQNPNITLNSITRTDQYHVIFNVTNTSQYQLSTSIILL